MQRTSISLILLASLEKRKKRKIHARLNENSSKVEIYSVLCLKSDENFGILRNV